MTRMIPKDGFKSGLKAGDWVRVRSRKEILATLDKSGCLESLPFMPEMFDFCGKRFQVYKRAHKTCDTVFPVRGRKLTRTVHLETRCTGQAHGDCQAGCLLFWKEGWLEPSPDPSDADQARKSANPANPALPMCTEADVWGNTSRIDDNGERTFVCQATRLPYYTSDLDWWDLRQYIEDYASGNVTLWRLICGFFYSMYYNLSQAGVGLGRPLRWLYNRAYPIWGGPMFPRNAGAIPPGQPTPIADLKLQPGELVRIKPYSEILRTLTTDGRNRGMYWDAELVPYCGGTYRVLRRVAKIVNEQTGKLQDIKNPCVILDSVVCQARYSACRMFCPRSIYSWWREIWLERVEPQQATHEEAAQSENTYP